MFISKLEYKRWRGASYRFAFSPSVNVIVGMNGTGKTNMLELLAMLTGHDDATKYLLRDGDEFDYVKVEVKWKGGSAVLEMENFDFEDLSRIAEFKAKLPRRASFVLQQESMKDDRLVTDRREPVECQKDMLQWLDVHGLGVNKQFHFVEGHSASLLVSDTGAQRYMLHLGMRRAPTETPMLVEHPDRSLHTMLKETVPEYLLESNDQQVIITTHSPELLGHIMDGDPDRNYWRSPGNGLSKRHGKKNWHGRQDLCIALDDESVRW